MPFNNLLDIWHWANVQPSVLRRKFTLYIRYDAQLAEIQANQKSPCNIVGFSSNYGVSEPTLDVGKLVDVVEQRVRLGTFVDVKSSLPSWYLNLGEIGF